MHPARALVHVHIVARRGHKGPPPGHTHGQTALRGLGVAPAYGPDGHAERFGQFPVRRQRFAGRKTAILNALRDGVGNEHVLGLSGMFPRLILIQSEQFHTAGLQDLRSVVNRPFAPGLERIEQRHRHPQAPLAAPELHARLGHTVIIRTAAEPEAVPGRQLHAEPLVTRGVLAVIGFNGPKPRLFEPGDDFVEP